MTNNQEVLELAKKCGALELSVAAYKGYLAFTPEQLYSFAAALEEKCQDQIAMLRNKIEQAISVYGTNHCHKRLQEALSATQQSADAFVAEVGAKALEDYLARVNNTTLLPGIDFLQAMSIANAMIAELRNSAAQPEGKDGK